MQKTKPIIVNELNSCFELLYKTACLVPDALFNSSKENKWTPAENISHLITATKITALPFRLPKFVPLLLYGRGKGVSRTYVEVVATYESKLASGAKATGVYVPAKTIFEQEKLCTEMLKQGDKLVQAITNKWTEEQLDNYQVKHPILGKLTMRELAYFTIYHNIHHMETIRKYYL